MEVTCTRCHQSVEAGTCFCPSCGLPQLVYSAEGAAEQNPAEHGEPVLRDAGSVNWKPAMRAALMLAIPAGILSSAYSPLDVLSLFWMAGAAIWAVALYLRSQRPAWITIGAGVRIGLVTGLLAGWLAFGASGGALFTARYAFHRSSQIDSSWKAQVAQTRQMSEQMSAWMDPGDAAQAETMQKQMESWWISPEGHAGLQAFSFAMSSLFFVLFAMAGGALGARLLGRPRRTGV
ncbi:MAG: hypothetical protein ACRD3N_18325 [Terracidiphilus sp.]